MATNKRRSNSKGGSSRAKTSKAADATPSVDPLDDPPWGNYSEEAGQLQPLIMEPLGLVAQNVISFENHILETIASSLMQTAEDIQTRENGLKAQIASEFTPAVLATTRATNQIHDYINNQLGQINEAQAGITQSPVHLPSDPNKTSNSLSVQDYITISDKGISTDQTEAQRISQSSSDSLITSTPISSTSSQSSTQSSNSVDVLPFIPNPTCIYDISTLTAFRPISEWCIPWTEPQRQDLSFGGNISDWRGECPRYQYYGRETFALYKTYLGGWAPQGYAGPGSSFTAQSVDEEGNPITVKAIVPTPISWEDGFSIQAPTVSGFNAYGECAAFKAKPLEGYHIEQSSVGLYKTIAPTQYWVQDKKVPLPEPSPLPEPPQPEPTPTPDDSTETTKTDCCCGKDEDHPCWQQFASPQGGDYGLKVDSGLGHRINDLTEIRPLPKVGQADKVDFQFNLMANANDTINCDTPYQLEILARSEKMSDLMADLTDFTESFSRMKEDFQKGQSWIFSTLLYPFIIILQSIAYFIGTVIDIIARRFADLGPEWSTYFRTNFVMNLLNNCSLKSMTKAANVLAYSSNLKLPIRLPSAAEAGSAWLAGTIDFCTYKTWVQSNDQVFSPYDKVVESGKLKMSPLQLATLDKRHKLKRGDLKTRLRELGSLEETDADETLALFEQLPGPSDIVRFMVRDVENKRVVDRFNLDDQFTENYTGQLKEWGEQQGVPDILAQYYWRAHWSIPSPTQLYEMLHRLRHSGEFGTEQEVYDDVKTALRQADILPFWIDRLISVSFRPLTRIDSRRAYNEGIITDDEYLRFMYSNGYSDSDAITLLRFAKTERSKHVRNQPAVKEYARGYIGLDQLKQELARLGFEGPALEDALDESKHQRDYKRQEEVLKGLDAQLKACRIDENEYRRLADQNGVPEDVVDYRFSLSNLFKRCINRHETIASLCRLLDEQLITPQDYLDQAKDLGYPEDRAVQHLTLCQNKAARKAAKEEADARLKEERDQIAQQKREERQLATQQRQALAAQRQRERIQNALDARDKTLASAAAQWASRAKISPVDTSSLVQSVYQAVMTRYNLTMNLSANIVKYTSQYANPEGPIPFTDYAFGVAETAIQTGELGPPRLRDNVQG